MFVKRVPSVGGGVQNMDLPCPSQKCDAPRTRKARNLRQDTGRPAAVSRAAEKITSCSRRYHRNSLQQARRGECASRLGAQVPFVPGVNGTCAATRIIAISYAMDLGELGAASRPDFGVVVGSGGCATVGAATWADPFRHHTDQCKLMRSRACTSFRFRLMSVILLR